HRPLLYTHDLDGYRAGNARDGDGNHGVTIRDSQQPAGSSSHDDLGLRRLKSGLERQIRRAFVHGAIELERSDKELATSEVAVEDDSGWDDLKSGAVSDGRSQDESGEQHGQERCLSQHD